jgi:hypothetical protein
VGGTVTARTSTYGRQLCGILLAAFTLSAAHTVYAWRSSRVAQASLLASLTVLLCIATLYYPRTFGRAQQTAFGWVENDLYVGLLVAATWLSVQRLRRVGLRPD